MKYVLLLLFLICTINAKAVENLNDFSFNTNAPANNDIPNWGNFNGWNYVGQINGAGGVYLGNGWVITDAHVGIGNFILNGINYSVAAGSASGITNSFGMADLIVFKLTSSPNLPSLNISNNDPISFSTQVAMIGYGGGQGETWGFNTITKINESVQVFNYNYVTNDFETNGGVTTNPSDGINVNNNFTLVGGDSGGAAFSFNPVTQNWELTGLNEAVDGNNNSYFIQLSSYAPQINGIISTPEPSSLIFLLLGIGVLFLKR